MEDIKKNFSRIVLDKYRFWLLVLIILVVFCFIVNALIGNSYLAYFIRLLITLLVVVLVLWFKDYAKMSNFVKTINCKEYRIIDNTVLSDDRIYSYSFSKFISIGYDEIISVSHNDNIFEKVRKPYKGNHSITIKTDCDVIVVKISDALKAGKVINYLAGKNSNIKIYGISDREDVLLSDLDNWHVDNRF